MTLLIECDVLGFKDSLLSLELGAVDLELMRIEGDVIESIAFGDVRRDGDSSLVGELAAELEVVKGDSVVRGLDPVMLISL